ncbi:MAG: uracil-DNA glycosylase family protein [Paramuribaculum sp.]|nr:uracil-DNA glycosylase family protein [Paramuribaculum sp.]
MKTLSTTFLDNFSSREIHNGMEEILTLYAKDVLGDKQIDKLRLRYHDMKKNFDNVTHDALPNYKNADEWVFSEGIRPHGREADGSYYQDTSSVPIPVTHHLFRHLRTDFIKKHKEAGHQIDGAVLGLDLPIWFNLSSKNKIMIVAQDPLRNPKWYYECNAAICSSPFGQHGREHREKGGKRFSLLINNLVDNGYGVYLTDCYKYYLCGWSVTDGKKIKSPLTKDVEILRAYHDIILKEISIVEPTVIVTMGNVARNALNNILAKDNLTILNLPHFSGAAQGRILQSTAFHHIKANIGLPIDDNSTIAQAKVFTYAICNNKAF